MQPGLPLLANARVLAGNVSAAQAAAAMEMLESVLASLPPLPPLPHAGWVCAAAALACAVTVCVELLLLLRAYLDSGGRIPVSKQCVLACAGPARRHAVYARRLRLRAAVLRAVCMPALQPRAHAPESGRDSESLSCTCPPLTPRPHAREHARSAQNKGSTALERAVASGDAAAASAAPAPARSAQNKGAIALERAVASGDAAAASAALRAGAPLHAPLADGRSPLRVAAERDDTATARLLLARGADAKRHSGSPNDQALSPLEAAAAAGAAAAVALLLDHGGADGKDAAQAAGLRLPGVNTNHALAGRLPTLSTNVCRSFTHPSNTLSVRNYV
jgi:hypothetical protein